MLKYRNNGDSHTTYAAGALFLACVLLKGAEYILGCASRFIVDQCRSLLHAFSDSVTSNNTHTILLSGVALVVLGDNLAVTTDDGALREP